LILPRSSNAFEAPRPEGLEPSTYGLEIRCSIRLSYGRNNSRFKNLEFGLSGLMGDTANFIAVAFVLPNDSEKPSLHLRPFPVDDEGHESGCSV
jgi:hypothetical protein